MSNTRFLATASPAGGPAIVLARHITQDKRYAELVPYGTPDVDGTGDIVITVQMDGNGGLQQVKYHSGGDIEYLVGGVVQSVAQSMAYGADDVIGIATDRVSGKVAISKNGAWAAGANPESGAALFQLTLNTDIQIVVSRLPKGMGIASYTLGTNYNRPLNHTTFEGVSDTAPDSFSFPTVVTAQPNSTATSASVTPINYSSPAPISVTNGSYSINGGAFTNQPGTIQPGQSVRAQGLSGANASDARTVTLTIGGVSGTFNIVVQATTPLGLTANPTSSSASRNLETSTSLSTVVQFTPSGGNAPYRLEMFEVSGSGISAAPSSQNIAAGASASVTFSSSRTTDGSYSKTWRARVTDSIGATYSVDVPVTHQYFTNSGPGGGCVTDDMWLRPDLQAKNVKVGDTVRVMSDAFEHGDGVITALRRSVQPALELETIGGVRLRCSDTTPFVLKDGSTVLAPTMLNKSVLVETGVGSNEFEWQEVASLRQIGDRLVYLITVNNMSYAAGEPGARRVISHNVAMKP